MNNRDENPVYPIDINIFKEHTCQSFLTILDLLPNKEKTLIIEQSCIFKLNYIASTKQLIEKKVIKNFLFESKDFISPTPILIYMLPPSSELLKSIEFLFSIDINIFYYFIKIIFLIIS